MQRLDGELTPYTRPAAARLAVREGLEVPAAPLAVSRSDFYSRSDFRSEHTREHIPVRIPTQLQASAAQLLSIVEGAVSRFQHNSKSMAIESSGDNGPALALASLQPIASGLIASGRDRRIGEYQLVDPRKHRHARASLERLQSDDGAVLACSVNDSRCFASFSHVSMQGIFSAFTYWAYNPIQIDFAILVCLVGHFGLYICFDFLDFGNGPCHSRAWKT